MNQVYYEHTDNYGIKTTYKTYPELQKALAERHGTYITRYKTIPEPVHMFYRGARGVTRSEYMR